MQSSKNGSRAWQSVHAENSVSHVESLLESPVVVRATKYVYVRERFVCGAAVRGPKLVVHSMGFFSRNLVTRAFLGCHRTTVGARRKWIFVDVKDYYRDYLECEEPIYLYLGNMLYVEVGEKRVALGPITAQRLLLRPREKILSLSRATGKLSVD